MNFYCPFDFGLSAGNVAGPAQGNIVWATPAQPVASQVPSAPGANQGSDVPNLPQFDGADDDDPETHVTSVDEQQSSSAVPEEQGATNGQDDGYVVAAANGAVPEGDFPVTTDVGSCRSLIPHVFLVLFDISDLNVMFSVCMRLLNSPINDKSFSFLPDLHLSGTPCGLSVFLTPHLSQHQGRYVGQNLKPSDPRST